MGGRTTERIVLATVPSESSRAFVMPPGGPQERVRHFFSARSYLVIAVALPALVLSLLTMIWLGRANIGHGAGLDYQVYRWAVHTWFAGGDIVNTRPTTSLGFKLPWVYPPFALLPLTPLAIVPFVAGLLLLYAINLFVICVVVSLVLRHVWPGMDKRAALAIGVASLPLALFLEPVYANFGLGQINIALMGLVVIDCLSPNPRWPRGLLVGVAAAIKLTPAAFLLFFLVRKDYRAVVVAALTAVGGTLLGFLINFDASMAYWFNKGPASGVSGSTFHTNQSILGGLARLDVPTAWQFVVWGVLALALVSLTAWIVHHVGAPLALAANGLLALLISPTSWSDHWVWVVPGLALAYGYAMVRFSWGWLITGLVINFAAVMASFRYLAGIDPLTWEPWQHFVGASYLLLGIGMLTLLAWRAKQERPEQSRVGVHEPDRAPILHSG